MTGVIALFVASYGIECVSTARISVNGVLSTYQLNLRCPDVVDCDVPRDSDFANPRYLSGPS